MAMIVLDFVQMFKDAGLSMATVQQEGISHQQVSTLFWLNALISTLVRDQDLYFLSAWGHGGDGEQGFFERPWHPRILERFSKVDCFLVQRRSFW
jgi:hypothetical protein